MKKIVFIFLSVLSFGADINEQFNKKYLSNVNLYKQDINNSQMLDKLQSTTSSMKLKIEFDKNDTKKYSQGFSIAKSKEANNIAENINENLRSDKFNSNVKGMEEYILSDKGFAYQKYLGKYEKFANKVIKGKVNKNNFLTSKEKIYLVISSSMPESTIQNYFEAAQPVNTDITFVLRGFIGDAKYIKPTLKWISKIMTKPNCTPTNKKDDKCKYKVNIVINPKVTEYFNISEVPAVIFVKNYNGILDKYKTMPKKEANETAYIAYGDANLIYVLEKINKKAKDKGLEKLIKAMRKGFFK